MVQIEKQEFTPKCPHCERTVEKLVEVDRGWFFVQRVFCCPHCQKIVGMTAGAS